MHNGVLSRRLERRHLTIGVCASTLLHAGLLVTAIAATMAPWFIDPWSLPGARVIEVSCAPDGRRARSETERAVELAKEPEPPPVHVVSDPAEVTGPMVRARIEKLADEAGTQPLAENLSKLAHLSERLSRVSSAPSVDAMAGAMHSMLGTKPRATEPVAAPPQAVFDYDTAQFYDVRRIARPEGGWRYRAVLIDHAGLTCETELDAETGAKLYKIMQQIKASPLLEMVYRRMAMPLIDQLLGGARRAAEAGRTVEQAAQQAQANPAPRTPVGAAPESVPEPPAQPPSKEPVPASKEPENPFDDAMAAPSQ